MFQSVVGIGQQIDAMLKSFAQAMPEGAQLFAQAAEMIKQGIAKGIAASKGTTEAPALTPTNPGNSFPGGGHSSSPPPGQ